MRWFELNIIAPLDRLIDRFEKLSTDSKALVGFGALFVVAIVVAAL